MPEDAYMSAGLLELTEIDTKKHPRQARSQNPLAHLVFATGASARLNQAVVCDIEITTGGRKSVKKSGEYFCDLGGAWFILALPPFGFSLCSGVFANSIEIGAGRGLG